MAALPSLLTLTLLAIGVTLPLTYLILLNRLFRGTPDDIQRASPTRWTPREIKQTEEKLLKHPINHMTYATKLPPRLDRRYIVTGGSGLVGGHIILQLLERGERPESIRNVDFSKPHRADHLADPRFARIKFIRTDISLAESTAAAFDAPWDSTVAKLPLTVFHTAAIIIPSDRSPLSSKFLDSVNIGGVKNVIQAAENAGADVLVSTSSASISIRPVELMVPPWRLFSWPKNYAQVLDTTDFEKPLRPRDDFFANYPYSKAIGERLVCSANSESLRTGCIRPANGVYGHPSDNMVGAPLNNGTQPNWISPITQNYVHGANCAVAHLQFEAILAKPDSSQWPQAGRPFVITDPNPPIKYSDMYLAIKTLVPTFKAPQIPPGFVIPLSYAVEFYNVLPYRVPLLAAWLPRLTGDIKHLQPGIFSICTQLVADDTPAKRSIAQGGLGYRGLMTTLEGMVQEIMDWKDERRLANGSAVAYISSVNLADQIKSLGTTAATRQG